MNQENTQQVAESPRRAIRRVKIEVEYESPSGVTGGTFETVIDEQDIVSAGFSIDKHGPRDVFSVDDQYGPSGSHEGALTHLRLDVAYRSAK